MEVGSYTDFSLASAKYITKYTGVWLPQNVSEERQRKISVSYMSVAIVFGIYVNAVDIHHSWGDASDCMLVVLNVIAICMAAIKMLVLNFNRAKLVDAFFFAQRHFWHNNYNSEEQLIFSVSVKYCTRFILFVFAAPPATLTGYVVTPIIENIGRNNSDRILPFKMWVEWPVAETPYFELMFTFQVLCIYLIGLAYVCPETFLCLFNLHVMGQFRILQYRMLRFWNVGSKEINDPVMYADHCYAALKKCIQHHQLLIEFCEKLEQLYTMTIFVHMVVLSLLMGLDCYQIVVADTSFSIRIMFICHIVASLIHLCILTYTCDFMMDESTNIITTVYSGLWSTLPMNKVGRSLRSDLRFIMIRSLKPCCLTAGGFFPVSLQTFTSLLSTAFSYFTLMREAFMRTENE